MPCKTRTKWLFSGLLLRPAVTATEAYVKETIFGPPPQKKGFSNLRGTGARKQNVLELETLLLSWNTLAVREKQVFPPAGTS